MLAMIGGIWVEVRWILAFGRRCIGGGGAALIGPITRQPLSPTRGCELRAFSWWADDVRLATRPRGTSAATDQCRTESTGLLERKASTPGRFFPMCRDY